jgi:hypothetical protein
VTRDKNGIPLTPPSERPHGCGPHYQVSPPQVSKDGRFVTMDGAAYSALMAYYAMTVNRKSKRV